MKKFAFISLLFIAFTDCKQASHKEAAVSPSTSVQKDKSYAAPIEMEAAKAQDTLAQMTNATEELEKPQATNKTATPSVSEPQKPARKVIRTAEMRFKVSKTDNATYKIEKIATQFGGYVTESQMNSTVVSQRDAVINDDSVMQITQYQLENAMTVRIPNQQLDTFLTEISRIYLFLDHRRISADDVTLAYLSEQLKAKVRERAAQRIQNATDSKGKRLDDIVNAENVSSQLNEGAIDAQIGNMQKDFNVQYSVVNLNMYQDMDIVKTMKANPSLYAYGPGFFTRLKEAIASGWYAILDILLVFISLWYLFVIGGLVWFLYKKYNWQVWRKVQKV